MSGWLGAERERLASSKAEEFALALMIVGMLVLLGWLVHPWYDAKNDSSIYIAAARSIAAGEGYTYLEMPFHLRPPGFSVLISPIVGTLGAQFHVLNLYVGLWGVAGVVLLFFYLRTRLGWPLAWLASVAVWLNPGYQRFATQIMSDVPGTTLLLACLLLERWAARTPSWRWDLLLGASIGISAYVRSITVLLVPAILVARILERSTASERAGTWTTFSGHLAALVVGASVVLAPWSVRNHLRAPPPPADQTSLYDYSTAIFHEDKGDPASPRVPWSRILQRTPERGADIATSLVTRMQSAGKEPGPVPALLIIGCWLYVLVKRRAAGDFFVAGVLVVLLLYPGFQDRLLLPVYSLLLACVVEALRNLFRRLIGARAATSLVAAALLVLVAVDFKPRQGWSAIENWHRSFEQLCSVVGGEVPPGVRLGAVIGSHLNVCLGRSVYGLEHSVRRAGDAGAVEQVIDEYDIETVALLPDRWMARRPAAGALSPARRRRDRPRALKRARHDVGSSARLLRRYFEENYDDIEKVGQVSFFRVRPRENRRPHVVVVVMDTTAASHLSLHGYSRSTSPYLERLAAEGTVFLRAFSTAPWTLPAHASLFTGLYPCQHRTTYESPFLHPSYATLAEILRERGYRTIAFSNNPLIAPDTGLHQGFEELTIISRSRKDPERVGLEKTVLRNGEYETRTDEVPREPWGDDDGALFTNHLIGRFLESEPQDDRPFFLFVNFMEPHIRYDPPDAYAGRFLPPDVSLEQARSIPQSTLEHETGIAPLSEKSFGILRHLYDAEVAYLDEQVWQLVGKLRDRGLLDDTLLIVTSDHGEQIGEHGHFGHNLNVYDDLLHVPLLVRFPGHFDPGKRIETEVQTVDVFATVVSLAAPGRRDEVSRRQHRTLPTSDAERADPRPIVSEYYRPLRRLNTYRRRWPEVDVSRFDRRLRTLRKDGWKLIVGSDGTRELYHLSQDPSEERDLAMVHVALADRMEAELKDWVAEMQWDQPAATAETDEGILERMKALGYAD